MTEPSTNGGGSADEIVGDFPDRLRNFFLYEMERLGVKGDIDGGGCDSGDWRDFVMSEARQGIGHLTDEIVRLRSEVELWKGAHGTQTMATFDAMVADRDQARQDLERVGEDLDQARTQLAGCGVAALQNTRKSAADRANPGEWGWSRSYQDVCDAVDREMEHREAQEAAEKERDEAIAERDALRGEVEKIHQRASDNAMHCAKAECERDRLRSVVAKIAADSRCYCIPSEACSQCIARSAIASPDQASGGGGQ